MARLLSLVITTLCFAVAAGAAEPLFPQPLHLTREIHRCALLSVARGSGGASRPIAANAINWTTTVLRKGTHGYWVDVTGRVGTVASATATIREELCRRLEADF